MAKCVGFVYKWIPEEKVIEDADFLLSSGDTNPRQGESVLKERVDGKCGNLLLDIASDFIRIKQSVLCDEEFKLNCTEVQDSLVRKLKNLLAESSSIVRTISQASSLNKTSKHQYFIQFTYGFIEKLEQLMQMVGRLSEVEQKIYLEEQRKLMISSESITIHSLSTIWSAVLEILVDFCNCAKSIFNQNGSNEDNFDDDDDDEHMEQELDILDHGEFTVARQQVGKMLLMDLVITSWIKFNRLVKYDDLVKSIPFICPCHVKLFLKTLEGTRDAYSKQQDETRNQLLTELLGAILDYKSKSYMMTMSSRRPGIIPLDPCYATANQSDLAYFSIWHLYALCTRVKTPAEQSMLANCAIILDKSLEIVKDSFLANSNARRISPHQEERYKLLFHMLDVWSEQPSYQLVDLDRRASILSQLLKLAQSIDSRPTMETKLFDNTNFTVNGLTLFQLCNKLFNATIPSYRANATGDNQISESYSQKQEDLISTWNSMVDRLVQTQPMPSVCQ